MNAPLSENIIKVLQNDQSANELVSEILRNRSTQGSQGVNVTIGKLKRTYRPVTSVSHMKK